MECHEVPERCSFLHFLPTISHFCFYMNHSYRSLESSEAGMNPVNVARVIRIKHGRQNEDLRDGSALEQNRDYGSSEARATNQAQLLEHQMQLLSEEGLVKSTHNQALNLVLKKKKLTFEQFAQLGLLQRENKFLQLIQRQLFTNPENSTPQVLSKSPLIQLSIHNPI